MTDENSLHLANGAPYQLSEAFLEGVPRPLTSFALHEPRQRQAFLGEFCRIGEPALFEAVSHIWSSLAQPQEARCTAMGVAAGTGGTGKKALMNLLHGCLEEILAWEHPLPRPEECGSVDEWHAAAMAAFAGEAAREEAVLERYATIIDGSAGEAATTPGANVICGPWRKPEND